MKKKNSNGLLFVYFIRIATRENLYADILIQTAVHSITTCRLVFLGSHFSRIPTILFKVSAELDIFFGNSVLANMRQQEKREKCAKETQTRAHKKRILAATNTVRATRSVVLDNGEKIGSNKGTDFSHGGGNGVVLAADGGRAGFGGYETDIIAWTSFAEGEEDAGFYQYNNEIMKRKAYPYTTTKPPT